MSNAKKVFSIIGTVFLGIVACIFLYQFFVGIRIATTDFNPYDGLLYSDGVGALNFTRFFKHPAFGRMFANTFIISFIGMIIGAAYVFLSTLATGAIRKTAPKTIIAILFAIPLAIPTITYAVIFKDALLIIENPQALIALASVLPLAALFSLGGLFVSQNPAKSAGKLTIAFVAVKLVTFFVENFDAAFLLSNNVNAEFSSTFTSYVYEAGLCGGNFSYGSAVSVTTILFGIIFAAGGVALLAKFFKREETLPQGEVPFSGGVFASFAAIIPVTFMILAFVALSGKLSMFSDRATIAAYGNSFVLAILTTLFAGALTFLMVHAVEKMKLIGTIVVCVLCMLTNNMVAQFITAKMFGLVNTDFVVVLSFLRYLPLAVLIFSIFLKFRNTLGGRLGTGVLAAGAGFALAWGEFLSPLIYLNDSYNYPLTIFVRQFRLQFVADFVEGAANPTSYTVNCLPYIIIPIITLSIFVAVASIIIRTAKKS